MSNLKRSLKALTDASLHYYRECCQLHFLTSLVVKLALDVTYPENYPDVLPELSLEAIEGELEDTEIEQLMEDLRTVVSVL